MGIIKTIRSKLFKAAPSQVFIWEQGYEHAPKWDMGQEIREGLEANTVVYACVSRIVVGAKAVPWILYTTRRGGDRVELDDPDHVINRLVDSPNPYQGWATFLDEAWRYWLVTGNSFIKGTRIAREMREMYVLRPNLMRIAPGTDGRPLKYSYKITAEGIPYKPDEIMHLKLFHSEDDPLFGLSPVRVGAKVIDQDNFTVNWNRNLLMNRGRPDWLFIFKKAGLAPDQRKDFDEFLKKRFSGHENAGVPMQIEAEDFDLRELSKSPVELDYVASSNLTHRRICQCYGVPSELVGDPQNRTYSNQQEARLALYEETIFPLLDHFRDEMNRWVVRPFSENLYLDYDKDAVDVVQEKRHTTFEKLQYADWMTVNEQREATGYEAIDDDDANVPRILLQTKALGSLAAEIPGGTANDEELPEQEPEGEEEQTEEETPEEEVAKSALIAPQTKMERYWKIDSEEKALLTYRQIERQRAVFSQFYALELRKHFRRERESVVRAVASAADVNQIESAAQSALRKHADGMTSIFRGLYINTSRFFFAFVYRSLLTAKGNGFFDEKAAPDSAATAADALTRLRVYLRAEIPKRVGAVQETTANSVEKILREGIFGGKATTDIADDIDALYDRRFIPTRSEVIADTEVVQVSNASSMYGAEATGKPLLKYWITQRDDRVRGNPTGIYANSQFDHWHADKQAVALDTPFTVSGEQLRFPGDTDLGASPGNVINCRCFLAYDEE